MTFVRQSDGEHVRIGVGDQSVSPATSPVPTKAYNSMPIQMGVRRGTTAITIPADITQTPFPLADFDHVLVREFEHQRIFADTATPQTVNEEMQITPTAVQTGKNKSTQPIQTGSRTGTTPLQTGKRKHTLPIKIKC